MNKNLIIVLVLAVLVVVSAIQAIQLTSLKAKVESSSLSVGTSSGSTPQITASSGHSSSASSLDNLPSMVGGC